LCFPCLRCDDVVLTRVIFGRVLGWGYKGALMSLSIAIQFSSRTGVYEASFNPTLAKAKRRLHQHQTLHTLKWLTDVAPTRTAPQLQQQTTVHQQSARTDSTAHCSLLITLCTLSPPSLSWVSRRTSSTTTRTTHTSATGSLWYVILPLHSSSLSSLRDDEQH
jgi:hypothetical protein